ncbi:MAG: DUF4292 domain-containing protein [Bacteroidetes bacterium]|nr:DUF4292 domain-containing protein [Bacteroidota bacterium]
MTACQLLKKPTAKTKSNRRAPVNRYAIKERYGINTVDSIAGSKTNETSLPSPEQKTLLINNLSALWQREIPFETFSGKAKMRYESRTDKQEFVAHIRIQRDKAIWINVTAAMGAINIARVLITPDSIFFLNYLQREAQKMPIADAVKLLPVPADFKVLQNLIIGNVLNKSGNVIDVTDYGGTWTLQVADDVMTEQMGYNKSDSTIQSLQMRTKDNVLQGMINFGKYELTNGRRFATDRTLNINNAGEPHNIDMNFNKAEFDQPVEFPFSIPPKFKLK